MVAAHTDVEFVEVIQWNEPKNYRLWSSDLFECPECHRAILMTLPTQLPIAEHYQEGFAERIANITMFAKEWRIK
jgi:hypothetical protein